MKKINFVFVFLVSFSCYAQEFSFPLYFEDALGERDTLILGYDPTATHGIDPIFDEVDYGTPISDKFQIFVVPYREFWHYIYGPNYPFYTKKEIVGINQGPIGLGEIRIIYPIASLPKKISWDKSLFNDSKHDYSLITNQRTIEVNCIMDDPLPIEYYLKEYDAITIENSFEQYNTQYDYSGHLFREVYIAFGNIHNVSTGIDAISVVDFTIYPNPVKDMLQINTGNRELEFVNVVDLTGRIYIKARKNTIDVSSLPEGVYLVKLQLKNNSQSVYRKIIKIK
jgi:hypothetical protein